MSIERKAESIGTGTDASVVLSRACPVGVSCVGIAELAALRKVAQAADIYAQHGTASEPYGWDELISALCELKKVREG